ncbi:MerR family transcriptional regulator [Niallia sp. 01092]|uniref:MerR family transcriptional regulator n=1 Tax=unclassified Niallia TaxID=2837522 RepID=UPI003FD3C1CA
MFSISEAAEKSGISSYTLRYYKKIGILPSPKRREGNIRYYTEKDIAFMVFLKSLKETGMLLEEIREMVNDGCIVEKIEQNIEASQLKPSIHKRIEILLKHLEKMEKKKKELDGVISTTKEKIDYYYSISFEDVKKK